IGKSLQQLNLPVGKPPNLLAVDEDCANQRIVLEHGHSNDRARATISGSGALYGFCCVVGSETYPLRLPHPVKMTARSGFKRPLSPKELRQLRRHIGVCRHKKPIASHQDQVAELGITDPYGVLQDGLKNWRQ